MSDGLTGNCLAGKEPPKKEDLLSANDNRSIVRKDFEFGNMGFNFRNIKDLTSGDPFALVTEWSIKG